MIDTAGGLHHGHLRREEERGEKAGEAVRLRGTRGKFRGAWRRKLLGSVTNRGVREYRTCLRMERSFNAHLNKDNSLTKYLPRR